MSDLPIPWKKITRGLPKGKKYADDRISTIEEIRKVVDYPDRRIRAIVYTMASSGIRIGAWDYLCWSHIRPIERNGEIVAAKIIVKFYCKKKLNRKKLSCTIADMSSIVSEACFLILIQNTISKNMDIQKKL
jgi:hypothetical protein